MKKTFRRVFCFGVLASCLLATSVQAGVTIDVVPALGPNFRLFSPSFPGFAANSINELQGIATSDDRSDDAKGYLASPPVIPISEALASTDFRSWRGGADPTVGWDDGTSTAGAFSAERGTNIYMGLRTYVDTLNETISLSDLAGELHWEQLVSGSWDPSTVLPSTLSFSAGDLPAYTPYRIGVTYSSYGDDGIWGGTGADADVVDQIFVSGSSTRDVHAIFMVGLGDAVFVNMGGAPNGQDALSATEDALLALPTQKVTASYTIASETSAGQVILPEPSTAVMIVGLLFGFVACRGRRRGV